MSKIEIADWHYPKSSHIQLNRIWITICDVRRVQIWLFIVDSVIGQSKISNNVTIASLMLNSIQISLFAQAGQFSRYSHRLLALTAEESGCDSCQGPKGAIHVKDQRFISSPQHPGLLFTTRGGGAYFSGCKAAGAWSWLPPSCRG
jgi:hypothetical protein